MKKLSRFLPRPSLTWVALVLALLAAAAAAAPHTETLSEQFPLQGSTRFSLENLAGKIQIEPARGNEVDVEMTVHAETRELAGTVRLEAERRGGRLILLVSYPVKDYDEFTYPGNGESKSYGGWFGGRSRTNTEYQGRKVTVRSDETRGAVLLYADLILRLPEGLEAEVRNVAGNITADGIRGALSLDTGSGNIEAENGDGTLEVDTGSGDVDVLRQRGSVVADTGSGDVTLEDVDGDVEADTGSGNVTIQNVDAQTILVDTGSGDIRLESVQGSLEADTGSGEVHGRNLTLSGRLVADTGSGDVDLQGDFSQVRRLAIDTGSGDVILSGTSFPAMDLEIDTGSGGIDVDIPGADVISAKKSYYHARFGNGDAKAEIGTGSGDVDIRQR